MRNFLTIFILLVIISSCEKKEIPIEPHIPGDEITSRVELGNDYRDQVWFNLFDNEEVSRNSKSIWDLSFESSSTGWHILLNSAKFMAASFHEGLDINDDISISNAVWGWDTHSGALDSTAIGDWKEKNGIYLIDRGYDHAGSHQGYVKLKINSSDEFRYTISYAELNSNNIINVEIEKNSSLNFTPFSFNEEDHLPVVMPNKEDWDISFTQYTFIYYDLEEITPYLVVGVILNRNNVLAKKLINISNDDFKSIDLDFASSIDLNDNIDEIGHEWKFYNFDNALYTIEQGQVFIIRDTEGFYYKLRFIAFYNDSGEKGAPKFEFQRL